LPGHTIQKLHSQKIPTFNFQNITMTSKASGKFEVSIVPQTDREIPMLARMTIDKTFHGDLDAKSQGQMLSARTAIANSAGYVAIERVEGTLHGRQGSFVLQHAATMNRGEPSLEITVVPDSGTGNLAGLTGRLTINNADGAHSYDFEYTLPE
jgi:hypothetical protein